jgi:hypothetical protein
MTRHSVRGTRPQDLRCQWEIPKTSNTRTMPTAERRSDEAAAALVSRVTHTTDISMFPARAAGELRHTNYK